MTAPIAGNLTPTTTLDLQGTFILPARSRLDWKRFFQSTVDVNAIDLNRPRCVRV
jgi:hypothetical protein